jgi:hypothetical protein
MLVCEVEDGHKHVYLIIKVMHGSKTRYQKNKKIALTLATTTRTFLEYFLHTKS